MFDIELKKKSWSLYTHERKQWHIFRGEQKKKHDAIHYKSHFIFDYLLFFYAEKTRWLMSNDKDMMDHVEYAIAQNTLYAYAPGTYYTTKCIFPLHFGWTPF